MDRNTNVLPDECEFDPSEWDSYEDWVAWRAEAVASDDRNEATVEESHRQSQFTYNQTSPYGSVQFLYTSHTIPYVTFYYPAPPVITPGMHSYSLEDINLCFNVLALYGLTYTQMLNSYDQSHSAFAATGHPASHVQAAPTVTAYVATRRQWFLDATINSRTGAQPSKRRLTIWKAMAAGAKVKVPCRPTVESLTDGEEEGKKSKGGAVASFFKVSKRENEDPEDGTGGAPAGSTC